MKILVIDDNRADRDLIITHIKEAETKTNVTTDESNCLKDALNKIKSNNYDVILLDLVLPESDGIETVKTVISSLQKWKKNIPVIVLTGIDDFKVGREAWALGIKDYLIKDEINTRDLARSLNFATYDTGSSRKFVLN